MNAADAFVFLVDADEEHSPPELNGLQISACADRVFLAVARKEEDGKSSTVTTVAEVSVDLATLFKALATVVDSQRFAMVMALANVLPAVTS
jgi:hypothetical protein